MEPLRIGVLAVQGNFREHAAMLRRLGAEAVEIRKPEQLEDLDGLVIPGGESTTFMHLMRLYGLDDAVRAFDGPVFGTCAGLILLAREVERPSQFSLGFIDVAVERNAYGRQKESFETTGTANLGDGPMTLKMVFIRAPRFLRVGRAVTELAWHHDECVMARQGSVMVAAFHPELTDDARLHRRFLDLVQEASVVRA